MNQAISTLISQRTEKMVFLSHSGTFHAFYVPDVLCRTPLNVCVILSTCRDAFIDKQFQMIYNLSLLREVHETCVNWTLLAACGFHSEMIDMITVKMTFEVSSGLKLEYGTSVAV